MIGAGSQQFGKDTHPYQARQGRQICGHSALGASDLDPSVPRVTDIVADGAQVPAEHVSVALKSACSAATTSLAKPAVSRRSISRTTVLSFLHKYTLLDNHTTIKVGFRACPAARLGLASPQPRECRGLTPRSIASYATIPRHRRPGWCRTSRMGQILCHPHLKSLPGILSLG